MKLVLTFAFILLLSRCLMAQMHHYYPVLSMTIETNAITRDTALNGVPDISDSTVYNAQMKIELFDTLNISKFHVKLGSTPGASDKILKYFSFDVPGTFPDSTSYSRDGYQVILGLGNHNNLNNFYSTLVLERTNGGLTDTIPFNR